MYEKAANQSRNFLHYKSKELVRNFDVIVIENLHMKGVSFALHSGKNVANNDWREFVIFLIYKLHEQGNLNLYHFIEAFGHKNIQIKRYRKTYKIKNNMVLYG